MNKNQRRIRRLATKQRGLTYSVHRAYDSTCDANNKPSTTSFLVREIPVGDQPRKSKIAKVAGHNK